MDLHDFLSITSQLTLVMSVKHIDNSIFYKILDYIFLYAENSYQSHNFHLTLFD